MVIELSVEGARPHCPACAPARAPRPPRARRPTTRARSCGHLAGLALALFSTLRAPLLVEMLLIKGAS
eukprot:7383379-Prymnesium_polylepis.1